MTGTTVARVCTEDYYPEWSARGIRAVRCRRPAKALLTEPKGVRYEVRPVCGIHARRYERLGAPWSVQREASK